MFLLQTIPPENLSPYPGGERRFAPVQTWTQPYIVRSVQNGVGTR